MKLKKSQIKRLFLDYSSFWAAVDKSTERSITNHKISCERGCNYCCKQAVIITVPEALAIIYAINQKVEKAGYFNTWIMRKLYKQRLLCLSAAVSASTWFNNQRSCIFLKDGGDCWIYEYRPSVCRSLLVTSPQENCCPPGDKLIYPIMPKEFQKMYREICKRWANEFTIPVGKAPLPMAIYWANMIFARGRENYLTAIKDTPFENDRTNLIYWASRFGSIDMKEDMIALEEN